MYPQSGNRKGCSICIYSWLCSIRTEVSASGVLGSQVFADSILLDCECSNGLESRQPILDIEFQERTAVSVIRLSSVQAKNAGDRQYLGDIAGKIMSRSCAYGHAGVESRPSI